MESWAVRGADLGLRQGPLGNVGLEGLGRVVEEEAHVEWRDTLVCALVDVSPKVQKKVDDVHMTMNLEEEKARLLRTAAGPTPGLSRADARCAQRTKDHPAPACLFHLTVNATLRWRVYV